MALHRISAKCVAHLCSAFYLPQDKSFSLELKTPPASFLLKDRAGVKAGSAKGQKVKVGKVSTAQVEEIAKIKMQDLNCNGDLASAVKIIAGSARNMGIEVV